MSSRQFGIASVFIVFSLVCSTGVAKDVASHPTAGVPEWAKRAVWYQIFPERFRNGDTKNDPTVEDIWGSWPHEKPLAWDRANWTADWFAMAPWEKIDTAGFYLHTQQRRYGGDLQGILNKLDYLKSLGITALYINPVFESPSLHKYDAASYHHIDHNFGPDPSGDKAIEASENPADPASWKWTSADKLFLKLVQEVHNRGMRIIIDGVFNHVGTTFWAFADVVKNQEKSQYKDWFYITKWDDPATQENEFDYRGWYGVKDLPELRKDSVDGMVAGPKEHIHAVVKRWLDPNGDGNPADGIDGWRLDAADMVPLPFWRQFRTWCREINPEAYTTGEIWWQDWNNNKMFNGAPWLQGDAFDAIMNYRWGAEVYNFFSNKKLKITASEFDSRLAAVRSDYLSDVNFGMMNLLDSHDTDRLPSHIINYDLLFDHNVGSHDNKSYNNRKPNAAEIKLQKLMLLFQMTSLGAPMIYYGDEGGMWGGDDPDERKPMLWPDLKFADEVTEPNGNPRPRDRNVWNADLFATYKKLIHIRTAHEALQIGSTAPVVTDDANDVYAFRRSSTAETITVVINNSDSAHKVDLGTVDATKLKDLVSGKIIKAGPNVSPTVSPRSGMILLHTK